MITLKAIRREMLTRDRELGRLESIASLTGTTAVVTALATGGSAQKYIDYWLCRSDAALVGSTAPDRVRRVTNYAPATGTLMQAGTAYADIVATSEMVEILKYEPYHYDVAIQHILERMKVHDRTELPTVNAINLYWLNTLTWVTKPSDITSVTFSTNPVYTTNRYFEKYNTVDSNGVLVPDSWTLAGANATMARSATQNRRGKYSLAITRVDTNCTVSQTPGLLETGVSGDTLRNTSATMVAWVWSSVASQVRVQVYDGITTSSSAYHTGDGTWQELSVSATLSASASTLQGLISVETSNTVAYTDEAYVTYTLNDNVRRNYWEEGTVLRQNYEQSGTLLIRLPVVGRFGQYIFNTRRPYPQFDPTRVSLGIADADESDAPKEVVAIGAIGKLYEGLGMEKEAAKWMNEYVRLAAALQYEPDNAMGAKPRALALAPAARRF